MYLVKITFIVGPHQDITHQHRYMTKPTYTYQAPERTHQIHEQHEFLIKNVILDAPEGSEYPF